MYYDYDPFHPLFRNTISQTITRNRGRVDGAASHFKNIRNESGDTIIGFEARFDVPGYGPEHLKFSVTDTKLILDIEKVEGEKTLQESLTQTICSGAVIDRDSVEVEYKFGQLHVKGSIRDPTNHRTEIKIR